MTEETKDELGCSALLLLSLFILGCNVLSSVVSWWIYGWFLVPLGAPALGFLPFYCAKFALQHVTGQARESYDHVMDKEPSKKVTRKKAVHGVIRAVAYPVATLGVAYVLTLFV